MKRIVSNSKGMSLVEIVLAFMVFSIISTLVLQSIVYTFRLIDDAAAIRENNENMAFTEAIIEPLLDDENFYDTTLPDDVSIEKFNVAPGADRNIGVTVKDAATNTTRKAFDNLPGTLIRVEVDMTSRDTKNRGLETLRRWVYFYD